jgi:hypothetical protein
MDFIQELVSLPYMEYESDHSEGTPWSAGNHNESNYDNSGTLPDAYYQNRHVQLQGCHENVLLYNNDGGEVARGLKQALEAGDVLEGLVISPFEEAILIKAVFAPSQEVYEILLFNMEDCLNKVIWWRRDLLKTLPCRNKFQQIGIQLNSPTYSTHYAENEFIVPTTTFLDSMEELRSDQRHVHLYSHRSQPQRLQRGPHMIDKSRTDRMSMDCVLTNKRKVYCAQRCLHDVDAKDILILCCLALGSLNYEQRST